MDFMVPIFVLKIQHSHLKQTSIFNQMQKTRRDLVSSGFRFFSDCT